MNINETNRYKIYRKIDKSTPSYHKSLIHNKPAFSNNLDLFNRNYLLNNKYNKSQLKKYEIKNTKNKRNIISFNKISPVNITNRTLLKNIQNIEENKNRITSFLSEKKKKTNSPNIINNKNNNYILANKSSSFIKNNILQSNTILNNKKNNINSKNNEIDIFFDYTQNNEDNFKPFHNSTLIPKINIKKSRIKNEAYLNIPNLTEKNYKEKINDSSNNNKNLYNYLIESKNKSLYNTYLLNNDTQNYSDNKLLKPTLNNSAKHPNARSYSKNSKNIQWNYYNNDIKRYLNFSNYKKNNLTLLNTDTKQNLYIENSKVNSSNDLSNIISRTKKILNINIDDTDNNQDLNNSNKLNKNYGNNLLTSISSDYKSINTKKSNLLSSCKIKLYNNKNIISEYISQPLVLSQNNYLKINKKNKNNPLIKSLNNVCYKNLKNNSIKNSNLNKRNVLDFSFERTNKCNSYIKTLESLRFSINKYKNNIKTIESMKNFNILNIDKNTFNYERISSNSLNKMENNNHWKNYLF